MASVADFLEAEAARLQAMTRMGGFPTTLESSRRAVESYYAEILASGQEIESIPQTPLLTAIQKAKREIRHPAISKFPLSVALTDAPLPLKNPASAR